MPSVQCPRCAKRLTVSDWAPPALTCPDCLGRVENPSGLAPDSTRSMSLPSAMPRRVIPIEAQIQGDSRVAGYTLFVLAALLGGAAWVTLNVRPMRSVGFLIAAVAVLVLVTAVLQVRYPESPEVREASQAVRTVASGILRVFLIIVGVILLLIGTCAVMIMGSGWRG